MRKSTSRRAGARKSARKKVRIPVITLAMLDAADACPELRERFRKVFGKSAAVTLANARLWWKKRKTDGDVDQSPGNAVSFLVSKFGTQEYSWDGCLCDACDPKHRRGRPALAAFVRHVRKHGFRAAAKQGANNSTLYF